MALLILAGLFYFYQKYNNPDRLSGARDTPQSVQMKHLPSEAAKALADNAIPGSKSQYAVANANSGAMDARLARGLELNDSEIDQVMAILAAARARIGKLLASHAKIITENESIIRLETEMSEQEASVIE